MTGHYVQVRHSDTSDWVTIEVTDDHRRAAATLAEAFRHSPTARGEGATQVRVISTHELVREGGRDAVDHAAVDLWRRDLTPQTH